MVSCSSAHAWPYNRHLYSLICSHEIVMINYMAMLSVNSKTRSLRELRLPLLQTLTATCALAGDLQSRACRRSCNIPLMRTRHIAARITVARTHALALVALARIGPVLALPAYKRFGFS